MKKFKKSAVVIPALARIAVTAAASVSGTVAWFTANRSVTVNASNFTAQSQNGDLTISLVDNSLLGVTKDTTDSKSVKRAADSVLTDASFDLANLYTKVRDDNGNVTGFQNLGAIKSDSTEGGTVFNSNWSANAGSGVTLYYAVSWTWNFTYTFTSDTTDMALYFDLGESSFAFNAAQVGGNTVDMNGTHKDSYTGDVSKGFRLAMVSNAANEPHNIVWAPKGADVKTHVNGTDARATAPFEDSVFHADLDTADTTGYKKAKDVLKDTDNQISDTNNAYCYLGRLTNAENANSFNVVCTAWFEGTDETNVINTAQNVAVTATQKFYVRKTPKKK